MAETIRLAPAHAGRSGGLIYPYIALIVFLLLAVLLQALPLVLPIGPMYWDVLLYYDAIGRIDNGQWPAADFMIPVGPLEYWLAWFSHRLFPEAHPVLLTQLQWLPVTATAMALIVWEAGRRSKAAAWGLLLPWMVLTALPFNLLTYNEFAGTDAYGIYNRHAAHLMYLVAATVLFVRGRAIQTILLSLLLVGLAYCKVTAFGAVGPLLILGLLTGRIALRVAVATAFVCLVATGMAELVTGSVRPYLESVLLLAGENTGTLLPRFLTAISLRFDILAAGALLCLVLIYRQVSAGGARDGDRGRAAWLDADWVWLALALFCGLVFETQNTGSHPYIVAWPAVLRILLRPREAFGGLRPAVLILVAFTVVPAASTLLHKAARTAAQAPRYEQLSAPALGPIGRVSAKEVSIEQAERMRTIYVDHPEVFEAIARTEALPSFRIFSEHDYQYLLLAEMARAAEAVLAAEARTGERFETVFSLDFANPFPFILDRPGPRLVMIGADPSRSIPAPDAETLAAVSASDLILEPKCPFHHARLRLMEIYAEALADRVRVELTACYDATLKPDSPLLSVLSPK